MSSPWCTREWRSRSFLRLNGSPQSGQGNGWLVWSNLFRQVYNEKATFLRGQKSYISNETKGTSRSNSRMWDAFRKKSVLANVGGGFFPILVPISKTGLKLAMAKCISYFVTVFVRVSKGIRSWRCSGYLATVMQRRILRGHFPSWRFTLHCMSLYDCFIWICMIVWVICRTGTSWKTVINWVRADCFNIFLFNKLN